MIFKPPILGTLKKALLGVKRYTVFYWNVFGMVIQRD